MQLAQDTYQLAISDGIATSSSLAAIGNQDSTLRSWTTLTAADGIYYSKQYNIVVVTKDGVSLDGINFSGTSVQVQANNVTLTNCNFDASTGNVSVNGFAGYSNLTVDHCSFDGLKLNSTYADFIAAKGTNTVISNSSFVNAPSDAIYIENGVVKGNYIAGGGYMTAAHADGIWVGKTTGTVTIDSNIIDWRTPPDALAATNNAIRIINENGNVSNVTVSHNLVLGGSYSIFAATLPGSTTTVSNINVSNNVVDKGAYGPLYPNDQPASLVYSNNVGLAGAGSHFTGDSVSTALDFTGMTAMTISVAAGSVTGTAAADHIIGSTGNNWISAGAGNDVIEGGGGRDYIYGGAGNDTFVYRAFTDSAPAAPDMIYDFTSGSDKIDLSQLQGAPASMDAWTWLGSAAFSGTAWQVREFVSGSSTFIQVDKDGDMKADLQIELSGSIDVKQSDFILARALASAGTNSSDSGNNGSDASKVAVITVPSTPDPQPTPAQQPTPAPVPAVTLPTTPAAAASVVIAPSNTYALPSNVINGTAANDTLKGTAGNDYIVGGDGNDSINGQAGNDVIYGGKGKDILTGSTGADIFVYKAITDSAAGSQRDYIADFTHGTDKIDLSAIDANTGTSSIDSFTWIGASAFSNVAGQLHYTVSSAGSTIVQGDINGDGKADFEIELAGKVALTSSDFINAIDQAASTAAVAKTAMVSAVSSSSIVTAVPPVATLSGTSGNDTLRGGAGNDVISGGTGKDILYGGAGADTFVFKALTDSTINANGRDWIGDFAEGQDKIDLSQLRQSLGLGHLSFVGSTAFSGVAGEVHTEVRGSNTYVTIDANGDHVADFQIDIAGAHTLHVSDFAL